jgi:hypothetical protein
MQALPRLHCRCHAATALPLSLPLDISFTVRLPACCQSLHRLCRCHDASAPLSLPLSLTPLHIVLTVRLPARCQSVQCTATATVPALSDGQLTVNNHVAIATVPHMSFTVRLPACCQWVHCKLHCAAAV